MEETVTITLKECNELVQKRNWLYCLKNAGVDNWEGYGIASDIYDENYPEN